MNPYPSLNRNSNLSSGNNPSIQTPSQRQSFQTNTNDNPDQFPYVPNDRNNENQEVYN